MSFFLPRIQVLGTPGATSHGDEFTIAHHGLAHTPVNALCHYFYKGRTYNGFSREGVTEKGAEHLSVNQAKSRIFTRGVPIDIPVLKGVPYCQSTTIGWRNENSFIDAAIFVYSLWARLSRVPRVRNWLVDRPLLDVHFGIVRPRPEILGNEIIRQQTNLVRCYFSRNY